jgi:hypothetical protein
MSTVDAFPILTHPGDIIKTLPPPYTAQPILTANHLTAPPTYAPPVQTATGSRIDNHFQSLIDRRNAESNQTNVSTSIAQQQGNFIFQPNSPPPYTQQPALSDVHTPTTTPTIAKRTLPQIPQLSPSEHNQQQQIQQQQLIQQQQQQQQRLVDIQQKRLQELQQQQQLLIQQQQQSQQQFQVLQNQLSNLANPVHPPQLPAQSQLSNLPHPVQSPQQQPSSSYNNNPPNYNSPFDQNAHTLNYQNNNANYGGFVFTPTLHPSTATSPHPNPNPTYTFPAQNYPMNNPQPPPYQQFNSSQQNSGMEFPSF